MRIGVYFWSYLTDRTTKDTIEHPSMDSWFLYPLFDILLKHNHSVYFFNTFDRNKKITIDDFVIEPKRKLQIYKNIKLVHLEDKSWPKLDLVIAQYRWDRGAFYKQIYGTKDLEMFNCILNTYHNIPKIILDYDLKCSTAAISIPFSYLRVIYPSIPDFICCYNLFDDTKPLLKNNFNPLKHIVYVGNRYERDGDIRNWFVEYSLDNPYKIHLYGNWYRTYEDLYLHKQWWFICYHRRIGGHQFYDAYNDAITTLLITKPEYKKYRLYVYRPFEALYYGCIPLIPYDYASTYKDIFKDYMNLLIVKNIDDLKERINLLSSMSIKTYNEIVKNLWLISKKTINQQAMYNSIMKIYKEIKNES